MLLDGDGAFRHWKYPGSYSEQPAFDMHVLTEIQGAFVKYKNDEMERRLKKK